MNCPEKIVGAYLRLNGFFLLPHFTLLGGTHTHVDFLSLRPPGSREQCDSLIFPVDPLLFINLHGLINYDPNLKLIGAVVEVKGGKRHETPSLRHFEYAHNFFGSTAVVIKMSFSRRTKQMRVRNDTLYISLEHCLNWISERIDWMNSRVSKVSSWTWSEEFLSDLLYLKKIEN